jgi:outer membrane protein TolC
VIAPDNLMFYRNLVSDIVKGGGQADITQSTLDRLDVYVSLATTKQVDAEEGVKRALAALREAMGKGFDCDSFQLADIRLPELTVVPERCDIITQALARRGEMMAVLLAAEVFRLEVDAQGKHCFKPLVGTFALTSDIHSVPIPPGMRNGEYRPGAIAFEMPTNLAGDKRTRQSVACSYSELADAVVAKTRELISLEAEDGYLKWVESTRKVVSGRDAANVARKLSRQTREDANRGAKIKQDEILITDVLAGQATAAFHEAVFQQVLALAGLERITAGGFISGLTVPPAVVAK